MLTVEELAQVRRWFAAFKLESIPAGTLASSKIWGNLNLTVNVLFGLGVRWCADKFDVSFARSSGPGGQNVNKVSTKVDMRFKLSEANWLHPYVRRKLAVKVGCVCAVIAVLALTWAVVCGCVGL